MSDPLFSEDQTRRPIWGSRQLMLSSNKQVVLQGISAPMFGRTAATVIDTSVFQTPQAITILLRYQAANVGTQFDIQESMWSPTPPAGVTLEIRVGRDIRKGDQSVYTYNPFTQVVPTQWLCHSMQIIARAFPDDESGSGVWIDVQAVPTCCYDPLSSLGVAYGPLGGYGTAVVTRVAATIAPIALLPFATINRRQFFIQNNSAQDLAFAFSPAIPSFVAGAERWTGLLPGAANAVYESPIGGFTGSIVGVWRAADPTGEALVTEGTP